MTQTLDQLQQQLLPKFESELKSAVAFNLTDDRKIIEKAIHYSVHSNGKRIRPLICLAIEQSLKQTISYSPIIAVAIELIHCYSLIHDDLPAMDNDDFRRNQPTCHKAFREDIAILAGDILNTYAFEYLSNKLPKYTSIENTLLAISKVSNACGLYGMAGGQILDLEASASQNHGLDHLQKIHSLKTGAILELCFELPTILANTNTDIQEKMKAIGQEFGLLFQIIDDILDIKGSLSEIGKSPGKDSEQNKLTYMSFLGFDEAINEAKKHKDTAFKLMDECPLDLSDLKLIFNATFEKGYQYAN